MTNNIIKIKSYARRIGKSLSQTAVSLLDEILPLYALDINKLSSLQNIHVEIGFGYGEHLYAAALANPDKCFIGAEVYLNGICNLLKLCKNHPINNLFIYSGDINDILYSIRDNSVEAFYVFFPDPWTKKRYNKRRLLNYERFGIIEQKLNVLGVLKFITDIESYFINVISMMPQDKVVLVNNINLSTYFTGYCPTKYHKIALMEERKIFALVYKK